MSPMYKWNSMIHGMIFFIVRFHLTIATIHHSCNLLYTNHKTTLVAIKKIQSCPKNNGSQTA